MYNILCISNQTYRRPILDHPLTNNHVIWTQDTINKEYLEKLIEKNGQPFCIVNNNVIDWYENIHGVKVIGIPFFLEKELVKFKNIEHSNELHTVDCFNFIINKKQINRFLLIKLVEYFQLSTRHYTFSGIGSQFDLSDIFNELNFLDSKNQSLFDNKHALNTFKGIISSPSKIEKKFIFFEGQQENQINIKNYGGNVWSWNAGLNRIFQNTAVSLISESNTFNLASTTTEKFIYAVLGLNFPLWIGSYGNAESCKKIGFDIFDDVINHNYQFKSTLIERCYYAFYDNIRILTDLKYASEIRYQCRDRLYRNRDLLLSSSVTDYCKMSVEKWPVGVNESVQEYFKSNPSEAIIADSR